jgi:sugar (pentulose or hexulose) kinase
MMASHGIKASQLIEILKKLIEKHGDRVVITGGTDYPEGVRGASLVENGNAYTPTGTIVIR